VLTYIQTVFVPPQGFNVVVLESDTVIPEHFLPLLRSIRSHRKDHFPLEGKNRSLTATGQRSCTIIVSCYALLCRTSFWLHVPPLQWSTTIDPLSEVMAETRRRATASRSSTEQDSRPVIQILHDRTVPILKPTNPEKNNTILNDMVGARATSVLNTTVLPPPPPRT